MTFLELEFCGGGKVIDCSLPEKKELNRLKPACLRGMCSAGVRAFSPA